MFLKLFPVWAPLAALIGFQFPEVFSQGKGAIVPLLMVVMLCMGLTLRPQDFWDVRKYKTAMFAGMLLQFSVMPLTALMISRLMGLSPELTVGMVLVGSVAGGTSSNVMTYIAKGNVAMSVSMTALSTLMSVVMTPLLLSLLVGSSVNVPAVDMLLSLFKMILLPVGLGVLANSFAHQWVAKVEKLLAPMSVVTILIIIAIVVGLNAGRLGDVALAVVFATLMHNCTGLTLGYLAAWMLRFDATVCRTIAIEVGMQNSGLATALALKFFSASSALPGAIFSVWLNITGSVFASICIRQSKTAERQEAVSELS
ncbi:bile acid:sodium symporter family protein [Pseudomaricurvus alkylphenolicus]|uniref:bile acid:sodium symporter family protein n=1 Tax=Pseudomaricurvus alkylphenolicus TaxID=1306991 RepID=UPI00142412A0|nr:bile acid:sodium symporter family protein [Pseudomaricurvus alkylphenolicus]NIB42355.1 bile acid:sodium symporter family protein [Pseudomaricurvus alkylphenolicus]